MKRAKRFAVFCLTFLLITLLFPTQAFANSAEPPSIIVAVSDSPDDLTLSLRFSDGKSAAPIETLDKVWETHYFFYGISDWRYDLSGGAALIAEYGGTFTEYPVPREYLDSYNNYLTLDLDAQQLSSDQSKLRSAMLVCMRVGFTLIIEGAIFFLLGYRERKSWYAFLIINLFTQTILNMGLAGMQPIGYWLFTLVFYEVFICLIEMVAFHCVTERSRKHLIPHVLLMNTASLILGGYMIIHLPT